MKCLYKLTQLWGMHPKIYLQNNWSKFSISNNYITIKKIESFGDFKVKSSYNAHGLLCIKICELLSIWVKPLFSK